MRRYISFINSKHPKLIGAYANALYELARYAEREGLQVLPQTAIITSAGTLYPFMRETIERIFQCRVFNRYGSREVGDIACERPDCEGLWVAPWGNYVEIIDSKGDRVPDGTEGEILVTSLTNYAMPFVRYKIGDLGMWADQKCQSGRKGPLLKSISGRLADCFVKKDGSFVVPEFFIHMVGVEFNKGWIRKYQVIQKRDLSIVFRIVSSGSDHPQEALNEIATNTRLIMDDDCEITFEFVDDIPASASGKYRYTLSEAHP
jgi:phenylacetate-CoA ligase